MGYADALGVSPPAQPGAGHSRLQPLLTTAAQGHLRTFPNLATSFKSSKKHPHPL